MENTLSLFEQLLAALLLKQDTTKLKTLTYLMSRSFIQ